MGQYKLVDYYRLGSFQKNSNDNGNVLWAQCTSTSMIFLVLKIFGISWFLKVIKLALSLLFVCIVLQILQSIFHPSKFNLHIFFIILMCMRHNEN